MQSGRQSTPAARNCGAKVSDELRFASLSVLAHPRQISPQLEARPGTPIFAGPKLTLHE